MKHKFVPSLTMVAMSVPAGVALAQDVGLEEIVVTATRREESLQNLANSATVFSSQDLQALRVLEPKDIAEQTPGLLAKYGPNGLATVGFYLRGVGINDFTGTVDPSVGIYVDEVFQPTPDMLNFAVYDIERVEVLRGPQGTLYGRNSTGGAINFLTARPTEELEGFVRAGYGSYHTATGTAAISGPIAGTLLGRLSVNVVNASGDSGYSYNRFTDNHLGKVDSKAARAQLEWKPSDDFSLRLMYNYGDSESEQALLQHVGTRAAGNTLVTCAPVIEGHVAEGDCTDRLDYADDDGEFYEGAANVDPELELRSDDVTATINWDIGRVTLTSISGYADFSKEQSQDIDASPFVAADNFTFNDVENFSQEIRLTSDESFNLPWIVGVNYAKTDIDWFQTINLSQHPDAGIPTSNGAEQSTEAWAAFGQLTIPFGEMWEFTGGLRYTEEERDWRGATFIGTFANLDEAYASGAFRLSQLPLPDGDPGQGGPLDFPTTVKKDKVDYQAVLKFKPNDDSMYYLSVSEAFRSGGYSSAVLFSQAALEPYGPETLTAYEAGLKLSLADNRVRFNASAFYYDYVDFQATFVRGAEASARLQNAGDVEIIGMEASVDWLPIQGLSISAGLSLLDTEIVETDVSLLPLEGGDPVSIEGNEIPNAPAFTFSGRLRYETPITDTLAAAFQTDFTVVDEHFLEPNNREFLKEDGYSIVNARISLMPQNGPWEVSAWVKNIADEEYRTAAQDISVALGFSEIVPGLPRTWGVDLEYRF
jgi:iron complex outermembrane receptor protein